LQKAMFEDVRAMWDGDMALGGASGRS